MVAVIKVTHSFSVNWSPFFVSNILLHKEKWQKLASSSKACLWFTLSHCPELEQKSPWAEVPVGDTVLVARVVPVASVHTSPSFSLGSSSQAWQSFPRLRWIRRMPEAPSLLETTMSWTIKGCQQGESAAHAHTGESFVREMFFATITGDKGKGMQRTQTCSIFDASCEYLR